MSAKNYTLGDESNSKHRRDVSAVAKRVNRAFEETFHVESDGSNGGYTVYSGSGNTYTVDLSDETCTCPDGQRGGWCKHLYHVLYRTGELPSVVGNGVVPSDKSDEEQATADASNEQGDSDESDGDTFAERVERFAAQNPGASAIEAVSQLGINPSEKSRVEEILD